MNIAQIFMVCALVSAAGVAIGFTASHSLDLPIVEFSQSTGKCSAVYINAEDIDNGPWGCDHLPKKYKKEIVR